MNVFTWSQIDPIVVDFPQIGENLGFSPSNFSPIGNRQFRTYCVVWQFRENRPRDVEKSVDEKI